MRRCHKQYFLDLFSGVGGVARALRRLGFSVYEYDIANGQQFDLTNKKVLFKLLSAIRSGKVLGVMIAMLCTSFSVPGIEPPSYVPVITHGGYLSIVFLNVTLKKFASAIFV